MPSHLDDWRRHSACIMELKDSLTCLKEDGRLLGCSAVKTGRRLLTFQRSVLAPSSGRWVTSETSVNSYQSTRRYNPEVGHLHTHRRENLKSYIFARDFRGSLSVLRKTQSTPSVPIFLTSILILSFHLQWYFASGLCPLSLKTLYQDGSAF
jgi:hypothetical protein